MLTIPDLDIVNVSCTWVERKSLIKNAAGKMFVYW